MDYLTMWTLGLRRKWMSFPEGTTSRNPAVVMFAATGHVSEWKVMPFILGFMGPGLRTTRGALSTHAQAHQLDRS
jgi:hypothetical protein